MTIQTRSESRARPSVKPASGRARPGRWGSAGLICLMFLAVGCASVQPRTRAADRALDELLENLERELPGFARAQADATGSRKVILGIAEPNLRADISSAISERGRGLTVVARDDEQEKLIRHVADQLGDHYTHAGLELDDDTIIAAAGLAERANLLVFSNREDHGGDEVTIRLRAWDLTTMTLLSTGTGSSDGRWEKAGRGGVVASRWLVMPFFLIADVGRTAIGHAFKGEQKPTVLGTLGRSFLAIVYTPVAIFTSDYGKTRAWAGGGE